MSFLLHMEGSILIFFIGTVVVLFGIFPYLRSGWRLDDGRKPKQKRKRRDTGRIERLMDAATDDITEGWRHYMGVDTYDNQHSGDAHERTGSS
jgi:hypothetical protein